MTTMRQPPALHPARIWPAYVCAAGLLVYAAGKAWYAGAGRLGVPGGPAVPPAAYEQLDHVALRQWTLATLGLIGALLALATVLPAARRPRAPWTRRLLLAVLWAALLPMAAGAPYLIGAVLADGRAEVTGLATGAAVTLLWLAMTWSYQVRSRPTR